jgi:hypothetical protein
MCHVAKFNLSYKSLDACENLGNMKNTDPEFWKELTLADVTKAQLQISKFPNWPQSGVTAILCENGCKQK